MSSSLLHTSTHVLSAGPSALAEAGKLIQEGQLVAFPTETVYGLGANAFEEAAVSQVFGVKLRPRINPLIVHVLDLAAAETLVVFHETARRLATAFWPGGLTLVLPRRASTPLAYLVSAGLDTVAVRAPSHPVARALLKAAGVPIAAPSANRSGRISPTTAGHVLEELDGRISLILDGGASGIGVESTVVGFDGERPVLLRKGAVPRDGIERIVGPLFSHDGESLLAPGMMKSHYAPQAGLRLGATSVGANEALLAFGPKPLDGDFPVLNLSTRGDLSEAAANLFSMLRSLDKPGIGGIAVMPIPDIGLGEAINDRLMRAAAPRGAGGEHA
ncbi:MAG: hypothetical protein RJB62_1612 [Pseudomonadota bacterium]|jgi:L-threonylcarbamoyladenylate synthase